VAARRVFTIQRDLAVELYVLVIMLMS